jgi:hypothetical protein
VLFVLLLYVAFLLLYLDAGGCCCFRRGGGRAPVAAGRCATPFVVLFFCFALPSSQLFGSGPTSRLCEPRRAELDPAARAWHMNIFLKGRRRRGGAALYTPHLPGAARPLWSRLTRHITAV